MEARKISVKLKRDPRETAERHSQANPLTLECTLATGESVTETMTLRAELHAAQIPATTPLATTATVNMTSGSTGPWELEFSGAQMNQTVLPDASEDFWLVVYATNAADDLFTLAKIGLTLTFDNVSQVTPPPPEPPLYATYAFRTFAVAGQSSVVAETTADTLTLVAGSNITLTTNAATDTITIAATGGGGGSGDVTGPASSTDNAIARFDGTTGKAIQNSSATLSDAGGIAADTLAISTTPTGAGGTGIFRYDTGEKVPEVGIDGITLKMGVQEYVRVYNSTASTLTKGQVVYINGAQGNRQTAALAKADAISTCTVIGVATQDIADNAEGKVTTFGYVRSYDTSTFTAGDLLYLSPTTDGLLTKTAPASPNYNVLVAQALNSTANGLIYVHPHKPIALDVALAADSDLVSPSQKAVKAYVDARFARYERHIQLVAVADGTVAIPGLAFTAETTTGFSRPTANAIVASVAATERVRINASGATVTGVLSVSSDAAIGTTSALGRLHVRSAADVNLFLRDAAAVGLSSGNILESFNNATSATVPIYLRASSFTFGADSGGSFVQRMALDASGKLGLGTSSPNRLLSLFATQPVFQITNVASGNTQGTIQYQASGGTDFILDNQGSGSGGTINASGGTGLSFLTGPFCGPLSRSAGGGSAFGFGQATQGSSPSVPSAPGTGLAYGGGAASLNGAGGGGGAIEYIDAPALPGPQPYTVGAGGTGVSPGPGAPNNRTGGAGVIIVEEFY